MVFATQILYTTDKMKRNSGAMPPSHRQHLYVVGHRGSRGLAPENTVAGVNKALEYKVDEIEIDIRVTKDNIVVVHHNRDVQDQTTARYDTRHHTYTELKQHKPDLATLSEILAAVNQKVPLMIEVKHGEKTRPIINVLQDAISGGYREKNLSLGSKGHRTLLDLHKSLPDIPTVVIEPFSGVRATYRARQLGTTRIFMRSWWLWGFFIRSMARGGYQLYVYTINNPKHAKRWHKQGLAGVITDRPDLFI